MFIQVAVDKSGTFQNVNYNIYEDNGYAVNENLAELGTIIFNNCYNASTWNYKCYNTITDTAKNTWFRSPGKNYEHASFFKDFSNSTIS